MRRALAVLLLALSASGCRHWDVRLQGIPLSPQMELTSEEKAGALLIVVVGVAIVAVGVAQLD